VKLSINLIRVVHILDAYHRVDAKIEGSIPFPRQHNVHRVNTVANIGVSMVNIHRILLAGNVDGVVVEVVEDEDVVVVARVVDVVVVSNVVVGASVVVVVDVVVVVFVAVNVGVAVAVTFANLSESTTSAVVLTTVDTGRPLF